MGLKFALKAEFYDNENSISLKLFYHIYTMGKDISMDNVKIIQVPSC